jgi:acetyl-CoA carboxylase biotin carboxyl carrier protein
VTLTAADVAEIMRLVEESSFSELTLEVEGLKLNLKRGNSAGVESEPEPSVPPPVAAPPPPPPKTTTHAAPEIIDPNSHAVAAPLLGTFYRAPKPGAPPFVEVGSQVEEETVVGII